MIAECFLDTNVLVYAALGREAAPEKHAKAREIVASQNYATSAQVLQEFYVNVVRKSEKPLSPEMAARWVATIARKPCQDLDRSTVFDGIAISQRYQTSYWDGAILAAAKRLGVDTLYSEDLNHGQTYDGVTVVNPFLEQ